MDEGAIELEADWAPFPGRAGQGDLCGEFCNGASGVANEGDACRRLFTPKLVTAGWDIDPHVLRQPNACRIDPIRPSTNSLGSR